MKQHLTFLQPYTTVLILAMYIISVVSCKDKDDDFLFDAKVVESELLMEMAFDDVDYITYEGMELSKNIYEARIKHDEGPLGAHCVSIAYSLQNNTTTIDFGNGCEGPDGRIRKGKLIISHTDKYFTPGSEINTIIDNYSVNDILLNGIRVIKNISDESNMSPIFNLRIEDGMATWLDGSFATREVDQVRTWQLPGNNDTDERHYFVEGAASGTGRNGIPYVANITSPLFFTSLCEDANSYLPVQGTLILKTVDDNSTYEIEYGEGNCDNKATVFFNGQARNIEIK